MSLDPLLLDVLACPEDKGPLLWFEDEDVLYNPRLRKSYAVVDGVPVLLTDEAVVVGESEHERLHGQGREQPGAGHRPGFWVSEQAPLDTLGMWEATAAQPEQVAGALGAADDAFGRIDPGGGRDSAPSPPSVSAPGARPATSWPPSRRPTWPPRSGWATAPPSRPSSTPTRWSSPFRPRVAPPKR